MDKKWDRRTPDPEPDWRPAYRREVGRAAGESWWTTKHVLKYLILPLTVVALAISAIGYAVHVASTPARVVSRVLETDNVIYNYEWFKRQYHQIGAVSQQAEHAKATLDAFKTDAGPRPSWDYQTSAEYSRLNAIVLGLTNQRANYVAEYNARARMATRKYFMGGELPSEVE